MTTETLKLVRELRGTMCRCGRPKTAARTFCGLCYRTLPAELRRDLYLRIGQGYEAAYARAVEYLGEA